MDELTVAKDIARYVQSVRFRDLDQETLKSAKQRIIDVFGCALGAMKERPIKMALEIIQDTKGKKRSTVLGTDRKVDPSLAAFVNGAMARYFDYNDTYDAKEFAHPSDNVFPVIAVTEAENKGGQDILLGTVLAYEVQSRLCDAASLWKRGWDQVTYGLVSVSAAASKIMHLSVDQTEQAINIALNSHIVMRQLRAGELSMWKAFAFSNSARNAILAATLAERGMTGPSPVFEGAMGFWNQVTGEFPLNTELFGGKGNGNKFKINESVIKYYPAEIRAQTAISAALKARETITNPSIEKIQEVEIGTNEAGYKILGKEPEKWDPKTKETADHSLPYIVAAALIDGKIDTNTFLKKRFRDKKTLDFMKRIEVKEVKEFTDLFNHGGTVNASDVRIKLANGENNEIYEKQIYSRGHPKNPLTDQEIELKFNRLAERHLENIDVESLLGSLWNLEQLKSTKTLFKKSKA
jgi:2-methylcitrate dehydratase